MPLSRKRTKRYGRGNQCTEKTRGLTGRQNTGGSAPMPPRHNLTDGYLKFGNQLDADRLSIREGVAYLRNVPGKPGMPPGPRVSGRVSCSVKSAICKFILTVIRNQWAPCYPPFEGLPNQDSQKLREAANVTITQGGATTTTTVSF